MVTAWINAPWKVRRRKRIWRQALAEVGLEQSAYRLLAEYNGDVAKGVLHSREYQERMAKVQALYDEASRLAGERGLMK
jgi:hypothetical protein